MLNNLIKLLLDTNRLYLDDIKYDRSIPIETNPELNDLELKLRKELAYINAMDLRQGNVYLYKSQFEPTISNRFTKNVIFKKFFPIKDQNILNGLPFCSGYYDYRPYFFEFKSNPLMKCGLSIWPSYIYPRPYKDEYHSEGCFDYTIYRDPDDIDNLYIDSNEYHKSNSKKHNSKIKMKKHRSKKRK